jgi:GNAT superfamily N-acetyltransferase
MRDSVSLNPLRMKIQKARLPDAPMIASVLQEAADWLAGDGRALWSAAEIGEEPVLRDVSNGLFHVARQGDSLAGVMKFELEDAHFWPDIPPGTSAFVHKLAVRRAWAKKEVSIALLSYARARAQALGRAHLRLDCVADRQGLRDLYEGFGFALHSVVEIGASSHARYEFSTAGPAQPPEE